MKGKLNLKGSYLLGKWNWFFRTIFRFGGFFLFISLWNSIESTAYEIPTQFPAIQPAASPAAPTNLKAFHRSGQTFITWLERSEITGEQYRIYRHTQPITASNIGSAQVLATLPEGSSIYYTERDRAEAYPPESNGGYTSLRNYVIEPLGPQLSDTTGLFVWTTHENQNSYYAVTTIVNGVENRTDFTASNTWGPITESPADPSPILVWETADRRGRVYTQFMDYARWNPTFENTPSGLNYAYNYFVGLPSNEQCGGAQPQSYALILHIEGYGSRYEAETGSHYYCAVEVWCDDPRQSWYFGYSAAHDYTQTDTPVTTGPIVNFTEERLLRAVYDTIREPVYKIDPQRIYAYGHSMGGSGALALGIRYPHVFAAVCCSEPMTNYRESSTGSETDWLNGDLIPRWGSVARNLPIENRGIYSQSIQKYNGTGIYDWQNHQANLVQRRKEETAFIVLAHGIRDRVIAWDSQGRLGYEPFYLSRRPFYGLIADADHTWIGFDALGPTMTYRSEGGDNGPFYGCRVIRDETMPGLTYASGSLPVPPNSIGDYNLSMEWSASWNAWAGPPVDTSNRWETALRSLTQTQTVDVTPRRVQHFVITPGKLYNWENRRVDNNALVATGVTAADADGLMTVSAFSVSPEGNRLILFPSPEGTQTPMPPTATPTPVPTLSPTRLNTTLPLPTLTFTPTAKLTPTLTFTPKPIPETISVPIQVTIPSEASQPVPLTVGIPVPPGNWNPEGFTVMGTKGAVPSQIRAQVQLGEKKNVSWLLVDFQAEAGNEYRLELGKSPNPPMPVVLSESSDGGYLVNTGKARYTIVPNSGIFGAIENSSGSIRILGSAWNTASKPATIEVVERGPLRATVCLRASEAVQGLDVIARLHFYAGLPYIRVQLTLVNHTRATWGADAPTADNGDCGIDTSQPVIQGLNSPGTIPFDDITWSLRLAEPNAINEVLYQDSSGTDYWNFYVGHGPRMQSGVTRRGYVRTQNGAVVETGNFAKGVLIAGEIRMDVPWFREMFPKALRARNNQLEFGLFPGEYSINHRLRAGEQKTHEVWISLESEINPPYTVRAIPSFDWLRSTHALGYLGPRTPGKYFDYENYLDAQFDENRERRDDCGSGNCPKSVQDAQQRWDHFGWMDFGDLPTDFEDGRSPYNVKYDVNLGFLHQALRIGGENWWKWAEITNRHFADIDIFHSRTRGYATLREWFEGGAWGHSLHDESGLTNPHRNCNNPNLDLTYGITGMAAWALLTGDEVVRDAALEMAENILWRVNNTDDDPCAVQAWGGGAGGGYAVGTLRGLANLQRALVWAWKLTGDSAYLEGAGKASRWYVCSQREHECGSWQSALFVRSHCEYILAAREASVTVHPDAVPALLHALQSMSNHITRQGDRIWFSGCTGEEINAWMLLAADAFALGYAVTGDPAWWNDYAVPSFNTGSRDPFYEGDLPQYHSSKELVNTVAAGTLFLHFANPESILPSPTPTIPGTCIPRWEKM